MIMMSGLRTSVLLLFSIVFYVVTTPLTTNAAVSHYHDDATTPPVLKDSSPAVMPSAFWLDSTAHLTTPITYDEFRFAATSIVIPPHGVGFAPFPQPQINSTLRPRPPPADASTTNFVFSIAPKSGTLKGPGTGLGPGAAHIDDPAFVSSRAARRQAMREAGIPTSAQPVGQIDTAAGRQYIYEANGKRYAVTQQTTDRVAGHGPHWEVGQVKPPSDYGHDPLGRVRVRNEGKVKVEYGE